MNRNIYISNCISRILRSECSIQNEHQRTSDIAEAVSMAAVYGKEAAHKYLIDLCNAAEAGKYREKVKQ